MIIIVQKEYTRLNRGQFSGFLLHIDSRYGYKVLKTPYRFTFIYVLCFCNAIIIGVA